MASRGSPLRAAVVVAASFGLSLGLRLLLEPVLGSQYGFMFFFPAVVAASWLEGRAAGLAVTILSAVAVWYFWVPQFRSFTFSDPTAPVHLVTFLVIGIAISHFVGAGRAAEQREARLRKDYEVTLRSIGDAVIATDQLGRVTFMNAAAERITNMTFAKAAGQEIERVLTIVNEETRKPRTSPVRQVLAQKTAVSLQNHTLLITADGREVPIADSAAPILAGDGSLEGVVLVFHDMIEQARSRKALRESNDELQQQVEDLRRLQDLSAKVYATSRVHEMLEEALSAALDVNGTAMGLLSLVAPDGRGLNVGVSRGFRPEYLEKIRYVPVGSGACGFCFQSRQRVVIEDVNSDPLAEPYREAARAANFRAVHSTPLVARNGTFVGVLSVYFPEPHRPSPREMRMMDLFARNASDLIDNAQLRERAETELNTRRAAEEELRVTNERFRLAAHGEVLTLFEQDLDLRYRWLYPQHAEHAPALGRSDGDLLPPDDAVSIVALKREVLVSGQTRRAVVSATLPGGVRYYDVTVLPKRDGAGKIVGVAGAAFDVTERKEAERRLLVAQEDLARANTALEARVQARTAELTDLLAEMEAFSYSISHDLRSPLRGIIGFSEALKDDYAAKLDEEGQSLLNRVLRSANRMNTLINDVLAYTRVNRGQAELVPVGLQDVLRQVISHAPELQEPRSVVRVPNDLPVVMGIEAFLTQVFANLLGNAVKFVPKDRQPQVEVSWEARGDFIRVWIADNGIGIRPEHRDRLFGLFERLDGAKNFEGTGMGLAIVRRALARMRGSVGVESDGKNGSRFWVELQATTVPESSTRPS